MLVVVVTFILSFCSLVYELIFARAFMITIENQVLAQTVSIGFYLLGMGVGSFLEKTNVGSWERLLKIEMILASSALCLIPAVYIFDIFFDVFYSPDFGKFSYFKFSFLLSFPLLIGVYTGREFVCLVKIGERSSYNVNTILAWSYIGNLFAGLVFPVYLYRYFSVLGSVAAAIYLNLMVAFVILAKLKKNSLKVAFLSLVLCFGVFSWKLKDIQNLMHRFSYFEESTDGFGIEKLKTMWIFFNQKIRSVEQIRSKYQDLDLVEYDKNYTLFINRKPQFSNTNHQSYHLTMLEGYANLSKKKDFGKILLLGGGDGILTRYLLNRTSEPITVIELDPKMIELAKNHPKFLNLNHGSFLSKRVNIINTDAFLFLKETDLKFDSIFIDFPLPTNLDLTKLYSVEFYRLVKKALNTNGAAIFDSHIHFSFYSSYQKKQSQSYTLIANTLEAAGIHNFLAYGPSEPFTFFNKEDKKVYFDFNDIAPDVPGFVVLNFIPVEDYIYKKKNYEKVNSIFKPQRFE